MNPLFIGILGIALSLLAGGLLCWLVTSYCRERIRQVDAEFAERIREIDRRQSTTWGGDAFSR